MYQSAHLSPSLLWLLIYEWKRASHCGFFFFTILFKIATWPPPQSPPPPRTHLIFLESPYPVNISFLWHLLPSNILFYYFLCLLLTDSPAKIQVLKSNIFILFTDVCQVLEPCPNIYTVLNMYLLNEFPTCLSLIFDGSYCSDLFSWLLLQFKWGGI